MTGSVYLPLDYTSQASSHIETTMTKPAESYPRDLRFFRASGPRFVLGTSPAICSGIIAYQVLQQESPQTIDKIKALREKHPWYANQWQARLKTFRSAITDLCCSCTGPGGLMNFVSPTGNTTGRGTTSMASWMGNRRACKLKQRLPCFRRDTLSARAGLLIDGWFWGDTGWQIC